MYTISIFLEILLRMQGKHALISTLYFKKNTEVRSSITLLNYYDASMFFYD
jgi:hypothetical protein